MIVQDVQENCKKNVSKNEGKTLKIVLGEVLVLRSCGYALIIVG